MLVTLNEDRTASLDGVTVSALAAGQTVEAPAGLAARWIEQGVAVAAKNAGAAPENKAAGQTPAGSKPRRRRASSSTGRR